MERVVYAHLGSPSPKMKVGPGRGLDNGVISVGEGRVMIVTVDPVSAIPQFGMKVSGWLSVHLIASDLTSSGIDPEFAIFSYNFPPVMTPYEREEYIRGVGAECKKLGIAIAAGHTGTYPGGGYTVIGSGTMIGFAKEGRYLTPAMAKVGDRVLMTKHAAIEAAASLALSFPDYVERSVGPDVARRARSLIGLCTTVEDARAARRAGLGAQGVTTMHDATEGGVLGALDEMARASMKGFDVEAAKIPVSGEAAAVCKAFRLDPLVTMAEGALIMTCRPGRVDEVKKKLRRSGIEVSEIGVVREGAGLMVSRGGKPGRFKAGQDRYWAEYGSATRRGLR
jgi:hydrogenase expression/formation protein HypE